MYIIGWQERKEKGKKELYLTAEKRSSREREREKALEDKSRYKGWELSPTGHCTFSVSCCLGAVVSDLAGGRFVYLHFTYKELKTK